MHELQRKLKGYLNPDGSPKSPLPKPRPTDAPTEDDMADGEAILARETGKKAMKAVKKNVIKEMVLRRVTSLIHIPSGRDGAGTGAVFLDDSTPSGSSKWHATQSSAASSPTSPLSLSSIASSKKDELVDMLWDLVSDNPLLSVKTSKN